MDYIETPLEKWISHELFQKKISKPQHLQNIHAIADSYDILLKFHEGASVSALIYGTSMIMLNNTVSEYRQREHFFHELNHVLQHFGDQAVLPKDFIDYQEFKAKNFALHYAVPTFMLHRLNLPYSRTQAIRVIAETFKVTIPFATTRLEHYENQLIGAMFHNELHKPTKKKEPVEEVDVNEDLPCEERPEFKEFLDKLRKDGFSEDQIAIIKNNLVEKENTF